MSTDLARLCRDLKRVLRSDEAMAILDPWSSGWTDGGCLVLAQALRRWMDAGDIMGVWEPVPLREDIQHHAVLKVADLYLDGDGVSTRNRLVERWREDLGKRGVELRAFEWDTAFKQGVKTRDDMEERTVRLLDAKFNRTSVLELLKQGA